MEIITKFEIENRVRSIRYLFAHPRSNDPQLDMLFQAIRADNFSVATGILDTLIRDAENMMLSQENRDDIKQALNDLRQEFPCLIF